MQSVSSRFTGYTDAAIRPISYRCLVSFPKNFNSSITFFTVGTSTIGGNDIISGDGSSAVQNWDKYTYTDYSSRIVSIEYSRENDLPSTMGSASPIISAMADVTFDNHDDYFTPNNTASPVYGSVLPYRPIRLYSGFAGELVPVFIGVTELMPEIDAKQKTAKFHCIDFISTLANVSLQEAVAFENKRTDQVISGLLQLGGMSVSQFNLDVGTITIPFAYFSKDTVIIDALQQIVEAEIGALYMDEAGVVRFQNRTSWSNHTVTWSFDRSNTLEEKLPNDSGIINVVEVTSNVRALAGNQRVWELGSSTLVPANTTIDIFADITDENGALPVTSIDTPLYVQSSTTSLFITNTQTDGSGDANVGAITLISHSLFSTAYKMTFTNSSATDTYINQIVLYGIPAKVTGQVYIKNADSTSVGLYNERIYSITDDYIQDAATADSLSKVILADYASILPQKSAIVKGVPQLQIGDLIRYTDLVGTQTYFVTKIDTVISQDVGMQQTLELIARTIHSYFRIGISTIGNTDIIGP